MSWSVSAVGKPQAVASKLAEDFAKITYCSTEETAVKDAAAACVAAAMKATNDPSIVVKVSANGSEYTNGSGATQTRSQSLTILVERVFGFVE